MSIARGLLSSRRTLRSMGLGASAMCLKNWGVRTSSDSMKLPWLGSRGSIQRFQSSRIWVLCPRA